MTGGIERFYCIQWFMAKLKEKYIFWKNSWIYKKQEKIIKILQYMHFKLIYTTGRFKINLQWLKSMKFLNDIQFVRKLAVLPYASTLTRVDAGARWALRITNLILQMDPKTWKQWNIWNAAAYIIWLDLGWVQRQYCQDRSIFS